MSIPVGSSSIPKWKRQTQRPSPMPPRKRQTRTSVRMRGEGTTYIEPSSSRAIESMAPRGVSVHEILGYVTPTPSGATLRKPLKNLKYPPKLSPLSEGMKCSINIIPALIRLKFEDHDLLPLKDVRDEPYESILTGPGALIQRIPQPWESGLDQ